jgi:uncharacterized protein YukE
VGYPEQVEVDPAGLRVIAAEVDRAAQTIRAAAAEARGRLAPGGQDGWDAAGAARAAQSSWDAFLPGLAETVAKLSADLTGTADNYVAADQAAADRIGAR